MVLIVIVVGFLVVVATGAIVSTVIVVASSVVVEVAVAIYVTASHCNYLDSFQKSPIQLCTCERVEVLAPTSVWYRELQQHGKAALLQLAMKTCPC